MIGSDRRKAIFLLHEEGMSAREIAHRLHVARNSVRSIISEQGAMPTTVRKDKLLVDRKLLERLHDECDGYAQRMHEKLIEEEKVDIKYSTLTHRLRELGIGSKKKARCDRVPDVPGAEMQHDTSPYTIEVGGKRGVKVVASLIYLRYSKRRYLKFYRRFNRFSMKCFFHEALMHWGYAAEVCIIDNTNLARLRGTGRDAVMAPEMAAFSKQYGFQFQCHEIKHSNRKAGNERGFWSIETNFFPGRSFTSLEDLNDQALDWATVRSYQRPVGKAGLIPVKAFEHERAFLIALPAHLPAPYLRHDRGTDQYGYAALRSNFFWVPGCERDDVCVLEYSEHITISRGREFLIEYRLPSDGVKNQRFSPDGQPKPRHGPSNRKKPTAEQEARLRAIDTVVGAWLDFALEHRGHARHRAIRDLFRLSKQLTAPLLVQSVTRALKYRIRSVEIIQRIAHMYLSEGAWTLPGAEVDVDEDLLEREAYREGCLTDEPSFSAFDGMLAEQDQDNENQDQEADDG